MTLEKKENEIIIHENDKYFLDNFMENIKSANDKNLATACSIICGRLRILKWESPSIKFLISSILQECKMRGIIDADGQLIE